MNWDLYLIIGSIIVLSILGAFIPQIKGYIGEKVVANILNSLPKNEYKVLNNIMLNTNRGTTQIDHVVVSVFGIFVIETKNYKGIITGSEFSEKWTKNMYGKKYSVHNPLRQNYGHVKALSNSLNLPEDKFIPIIVFSVNSEIKVTTNKPVVYTVKLKKEILSYQNKIIELNDIEEIVNEIVEGNISTHENSKKHVEKIKENIISEKNKIKNGICPKCEGTLLKRKGKYGEFTGCSNYPRCRFVLK